MLIDQLVNGIMLGSSYAMIGLGIGLIFGVLRILNLAQPEYAMLGGYVGYILASMLGWGFIETLLGVIAVSAFLGLALERLVLRPLYRGEHLSQVIATIGVAIIFRNVASAAFPQGELPFPALIESYPISILGVNVNSVGAAILALNLLVLLALNVMLMRTSLGRQLRAVSESRDIAAILGVRVNLLTTSTVAGGSALAGIAGMALGMLFLSISPDMGVHYGLKGLVIVIVGGLGSLSGAVICGFVLGIVEVVSVAYIGASYRDFVAYGLLLLVLLARPEGLFGARS